MILHKSMVLNPRTLLTSRNQVEVGSSPLLPKRTSQSSQCFRKELTKNNKEGSVAVLKQFTVPISDSRNNHVRSQSFSISKCPKISPAKRMCLRTAIYRYQSREIKPSMTPIQPQENNYKDFPKRQTKKHNNPYNSFLFSHRKYAKASSFSQPFKVQFSDNCFLQQAEPPTRISHSQYSRSAQLSRARAHRNPCESGQESKIEPWTSRPEQAKFETGF